MILKILDEKENKLLNRKEIKAEIEFQGITPNNAEVKKKLAEHFKANENLIVVEHIYQEFGLNKAKVYAKIYNSEENFKKLETKKEKKKVKEEQQSGEANGQTPKGS